MADEAPEKKAGGGLGKLFPIIFAALNIAIVSGGCFLVYSATLGHHSPSVSNDELNIELEAFKKSLQGDVVLYSMDTFSTNLSGLPRRLVRMDVSLEMLDEEGFEEVIDLGAETRDSIMRILNSKRFNDVESIQGKLLLKNEIRVAVNDFLRRGVVKNVYFTDFVVQNQ